MADSTIAVQALAKAIVRVAETDKGIGLDVIAMRRPDRFQRGGDHIPFLEAGYPAVRFSEATENYDRQHQTIRAENGRRYGDTIEFVDLPYLARVTALDVAVIRELASAPAAPVGVSIAGALSDDTHVGWQPVPGAAGYRIRWRRADGFASTNRRDVSASATSLDLAHVNIDDHFFGVSAPGPGEQQIKQALLATILALAPMPAIAARYELAPTPQTVAWRHYDATSKPALTVKSGDTVVVHTLLTNNPAGLTKAGVAQSDIEPALKAVFDGVPQSERGPGGHILTRPIAIEGVEIGDRLGVRILKIDLAIPYAYNAFRYGAGFLTDDFPYARMKIIPLDRQAMIARFRPGIDVPPPLLRQHGRRPARRLRRLRQRAADDQRRQHGRQGSRRRNQAVFARPCAGRVVPGRRQPCRPEQWHSEQPSLSFSRPSTSMAEA